MKNTIVNLMNCYKEFLMNVSEYTILTEMIKSKMDANKSLVLYYSLEKKNIDYSKYDAKIIDYLINNSLWKFLEKSIDENKVKELIANNILSEEVTMCFIDKESTVLAIRTSKLINCIIEHKKTLKNDFKSLDMFDLIKRRELARIKTNETRYKYYNAAKDTKDILMLHGKNNITIKMNDDIVNLEIKNIKTTYKKEFIKYLEVNNIDAFKYVLLDTKLRNSKDKKLDRSCIDKYKIDNTKECLFIKALPGLLNKYNKKKK